MNQNSDNGQEREELRRRAEEILKTRASHPGKYTPPQSMAQAEMHALIHDLQVHQIELEMQNEELRQAHENLALAHDRYFDLFDLAPVGYFMLDEEGLILDANLAGSALLGVPRSQVIGKALSRYVHQQDQDLYFVQRRKAYQSQTPLRCELRLVRDGSQLYARLEFARGKDATGQECLRLVVSDITEKAILEQILAKNQTILTEAEKMAHLGGWEWDIEKDEVLLSAELQRIYGCDKNRYPLWDFLHLAHPEDRLAKQAALEKALSGETQVHFEHRIRRQTDQAERIIQVRGEMIFGKTGEPLRFYGASQDVTEIRLNERSLQSYAAHLEALNRDLESFTYIASHDLQAPLRKIIQFGELVKTNLSTPSKVEVLDYVDRMQQAAVRMQLLVLDLLKYSRVTNGILSFIEVDLNEVVMEVLEDLEAMVESTHAQVEVLHLPVLSAERSLMRQLFQNLIENALKFHLPGKPPVIKIDFVSLPQEMVQIRVEDQGIGFDEQFIDRIFQPFERLHGVNQYAGTGIGLPICRKIVERHAGSITAHSQPGQGATFIVTLPVNQALPNTFR